MFERSHGGQVPSSTQRALSGLALRVLPSSWQPRAQGILARTMAPRDWSREQLSLALEWLGVPQEQQSALAQVLDRTLPQAKALREQLLEARDTVVHSLLLGKIDELALERTQHELSLVTRRGSDLAISTLLEISELLTPEQRTKLARWTKLSESAVLDAASE